ncbi:helix-turn-helix domain-containing protein [Streptomyces sp. NPDC059740]|uniref:helix-turn-helix domain-containing protein n=1 Tax=Streptomyces sp. NPDC059740 TaxID=3346926 RepID=UPI00364A3A05
MSVSPESHHSPADTTPPGPEGEPPDTVAPPVAPRLRVLRHQSGMTLEAAAERARLSPAHLSRLETGRRQPSLPVLLTLARTYGTTVSELLGEAVPERDSVIRHGEGPVTRAGGWLYQAVGSPGRALQALRLQVPHGEQDSLVRVHPGEEWLYVLRGELRLTLADTAYLLTAGDAAHFGSLTPHRIMAGSRDGVELLFVHTLLQSDTAALCVGPGAGGGRERKTP